jgi:hypothetical protein
MNLYSPEEIREALSVDYDRLNALEEELGDAYDNDPEDELYLREGETHGFVNWEDRILANEQHPLYAKVKEHRALRDASHGCISKAEAEEKGE